MKKQLTMLLSVVSILLHMPLLLSAKESGALIGLRSTIPDQPPVYRTLWIAPVDGGIGIVAEGEDLLIPRHTGFWRVGVERLEDEQWSEDLPWAVPVGQEAIIPELEYDELCEGNEWATVLFIGGDYVSFERESGGYCEGAAHPWAVNWLEVLSIDDLQAEEGCITLSTCVGEGGDAALRTAAEHYLDGLTDEEREMLEDEPSACSWGLIRRHGHWVLRGRLRYSCEAYRGHFADFDIGLAPPKKLVSHDELHPSWEKVKAKVPAALDAFSSPSKDILVVLTKDELTVHVVTGEVISAAVLSVELGDNEAAVMIQWAEGKHVQRWTEEIRSRL